MNIKVKDVLKRSYNDSKEELLSKAGSNLSRVNSQINDIPSFQNIVPATIPNKVDKLRYSVEPTRIKPSTKLETLEGLLSERVTHEKLIPLNRSVENSSIRALEKQREKNQTVSFRDEMDQAAARSKEISANPYASSQYDTVVWAGYRKRIPKQYTIKREISGSKYKL